MRTSTALILAFLGTCQIVYMALRLRAKHSVLSLEIMGAPAEGKNARPLSSNPPPFSWRDAPSTRELDWKPCYENKECTRLSVPLDYKEPNGRQASIALLRKKAELSNTSEYRGPVLVNPGGPGASGVDMVLLAGDLISDILGPEFDIVGFDPRGIGRSTPRASFFREGVHRALANKHTSATLLEDRDNVARAWSWAEVVGKFAGDTDDGYLRHIHTDYTARDMLSIVEAHGMDKILYWGFSYGAILGSTFAAMFPDRVGRLVIDGVPENEDYFATEWNYNLLDTDKTLESFFTGCVESGPDVCPFWAPHSADIRQNLTRLYAKLSANPIPVVGSSTFGVLDDAMLRSAVSTSLNSPYAWFPLLAKALADPVKYAETLLNMAAAPPFTCDCDSHSDESMFRLVGDAYIAIACNDGAALSGGLKSFQEYYDRLSEQSEWGRSWTVNRIRCAGWPNYPKEHFRGPFVANTSHPILLIGNTADPVTPLWGAEQVSKGFVDSVVLTQDSPGHASLAAPSLCTQRHVRDYFVHGTLPPPGTICPVDSKPFSVPGNGAMGSSEQHTFFSQEDRRLYRAVEELSRLGVVRPPTFMV